MRNPRILIAIAFIVIIIGVIAAVVLGGGTRPPATPVPPTSEAGSTTGTTGSGNVQVEPTDIPPPPIVFTEIVVAVQEISRGQTIAPNMVELRLYPETAAPFNAIASTELVIGKIARTDIFIEQPVLATMLAENLTGIANRGSDAAAVLPSNRVAVSVPIDRLTSVAYAIQPGDRVDVMVSLLFVDVDPEFQSIEPNLFTLISETVNEETGQITVTISGVSIEGNIETRPAPGLQVGTLVGVVSPSEAQRPRLVTQRTIQDALVIWLGDFPRLGEPDIFTVPPTPTPVPTPDPDDEDAERVGPPTPTPVPPRPDIVTLGVTPQDAVVLTWYVEAGLPVTFALRSATTTSQAPTDAVSLDYIMERYRIELPGKRAYSIEPAITSIRKLSVGDRITFKNQPSQ